MRDVRISRIAAYPENSLSHARCSTAHSKDYVGCEGVLSKDSKRKSYLNFMTKKTYCEAIRPNSPGSWSFYGKFTLAHNKLNATYKYDIYDKANAGQPGDLAITFPLTGHFVSSKKFVLTVKGTVTKDLMLEGGCAGETFTEKHTPTARDC